MSAKWQHRRTPFLGLMILPLGQLFAQSPGDFRGRVESTFESPAGRSYVENAEVLLSKCPCPDRIGESGLLTWSSYEIVRHETEMLDWLSSDRCRALHRLLVWSDYYLEFADSLLAEKRLPREYRWIPVLRSGVNPGFRAGESAGLWGMNPVEAARFGLLIHNRLDERHIPKRETEAAVAYLEDLHKQFRGNVPLVLLAFHRGMLHMRHAGFEPDMMRPEEMMGVDDRRMMAVVAGLDGYHQFERCMPAKSALRLAMGEIEEVRCDTIIHLSRAAEVLGASSESLRGLNPQWVSGIVDPQSGYDVLFLPRHLVSGFVDSLEVIKRTKPVPYVAPVANPEEITHIVKRGEVLGSIARMYGVRVTDIQEWNGLKRDLIYAGQKLILYVRESIGNE